MFMHNLSTYLVYQTFFRKKKKYIQYITHPRVVKHSLQDLKTVPAEYYTTQRRTVQQLIQYVASKDIFLSEADA